MPMRLLHRVHCSTPLRTREYALPSVRSAYVLEPLQTLCGWPWVGPLETWVQETLFHHAHRFCGASDLASSSLAAFVACSFPPHHWAQGKPRDLRDLSPIPADIRLYGAPLNGAPDDPSSHYRAIQ